MLKSDLTTAIQDLEDQLAAATERAVQRMAAESSVKGRKRVLDEWEKELTREIRPAYKNASQAVQANYQLDPEVKDRLKARVGAMTATMVRDRSRLEGLVHGQAPTRNSAGGAFPPPSTCSPQVRQQARQALEEGLINFRAQCEQHVPGEILGEWVSRTETALRQAVAAAEAVLQASGSEYREFLTSLDQEATSLWTEAMTRRDQGADKALQAQDGELRLVLFERLEQFPKAGAPPAQLFGIPDIDSYAQRELDWAAESVAAAEALLAAQGIRVSFGQHLDGFRRQLKAKVGDFKGQWSKPPEFAIVRLEDLDPRVKTGSPQGRGVFVSFYSNGHLRQAVTAGATMTLKVSNGKAHARYEDTANVAEFHPNGVIEEYGGRYERDVRARITFADWVITQVRGMVEFADRPANQPDNGGGQ